MIPRTVLMAQEVAAQFTTSQLEDYGNIILNGYSDYTTGVSTAGAQGAIASLTLTSGGTNYTNGTYTGVYLGGSVGTFGYATVVVAGGIVTTVTLTAGGRGFYVGQVLTLGNIPRTTSGTTATVTVASVNQYSVTPALKGWTTNYQEYYTQLQPNGYSVNPGDPTMFEYTVHSFTQGSGPISSLYGLQGGTNYTVGTHTNIPAVGGSGTGATLNLTVGVGGVVLTATINNPGTGYTPGDGLTVTTLGAGYGFAVFVGPIAAPITAIGVPTPGTGYTPGTYTGVATSTSGTGTGATLNVVVNASGQVTSAVLNAAGTGYKVGDTLTSTAIGGGTDFTVTITSVAVANPGSQPKWAQAPRRLINATVAPFVPPNDNQQAIQYSAILYPVADKLTPPPIDIL